MNFNSDASTNECCTVGFGIKCNSKFVKIFRVHRLSKMEILNPNLKIKQNDIEVKVVTRTKTSLQIKN